MSTSVSYIGCKGMWLDAFLLIKLHFLSIECQTVKWREILGSNTIMCLNQIQRFLPTNTRYIGCLLKLSIHKCDSYSVFSKLCPTTMSFVHHSRCFIFYGIIYTNDVFFTSINFLLHAFHKIPSHGTILNPFNNSIE